MKLKNRFSHWTPRYIWDRIWVKIFQLQNPDAPWLTPQAIHILDNWLSSTDQGLEFGSGRSTLWFAQRVSKLTSVEHDTSWHELIGKKLSVSGMGNVEYLFREADESASNSSASPYAAVALDFADGSLDFVLVDGAVRSACALASLDKVRRGGILIVDNANWVLPSHTRSPASRSMEQGAESPEWQAFLTSVHNWRCIWTSNGVTDTAIFFRSCES